MKRKRFLLLTIITLFALTLTTGLIWTGCSDESRNVTAPSDITLLTADKLAPVIDIQEKHTDRLLKIDGVVGTGVSADASGRAVVKVFTSKSRVNHIPESLDGVPVQVEETGEFFATALTGRYRPVPIGVSVGNNNECAAGTIGCQVLKGGQKYILSNNHVLARENAAAIGEDIVQPGRYDNPRCANRVATDKVADLSDFEALKFGGTNNTMDAAIALYSTTDVTCATLPAYYGFPSSTTAAAYVGQPVKKVGRTSSLTTGTVSAINVTINVGYYSGTAKFVGQVMTSKGMIKSGDSGSLMVTNNANNNPVALLFAGSKTGQAVGSPINTVLSRFNATICSN